MQVIQKTGDLEKLYYKTGHFELLLDFPTLANQINKPLPRTLARLTDDPSFGNYKHLSQG